MALLGRRFRYALALVVGLGSNAASAASVVLFDAANNTLPNAQGWTFASLPIVSPSITSGALSFSTTADSFIQAGYGRADQLLNTVTGFDLSLRGLAISSEAHSTTHRAGFSLISVGSDRTKALELAFWSNEVWAYDFTNGAFVHGPGVGVNTTMAHDYTLRVRNNQWSLAVDGVFTTLSGSLVNYTPAVLLIDPYDIPNTLFFGDDTSSASASISLGSITLTAVPLPAAIWLLAGALCGVFRGVRRGQCD